MRSKSRTSLRTSETALRFPATLQSSAALVSSRQRDMRGSSMALRIKLGDCYEIRLPDGRFAYCHYIADNDFMGSLIRVFNKVSTEQIGSVEELRDAGELFPPVFVGLHGCIKSGVWMRIGSLPIEPFTF